MTTSSQAPLRSLASPIVVVRFTEAVNLDPLTTTEADLAADVERYLQAWLSRPLQIRAQDGRGTVRHDGRLVTTFEYAPLGAHHFPVSIASQAVAA